MTTFHEKIKKIAIYVLEWNSDDGRCLGKA